jgi:hypothetical protein
MIAANNGWLTALDNLSHVPGWLSDALCRLSTGGGFATRALYENDEEAIFDAMRPIVLTGIEELGSRSDLIDRSLFICLPAISDADRRPEDEFWREFNQARPRVLGALLTAVSAALANLENTKLDTLPRMADFARWVEAAAPGLGLAAGEFIAAYRGNREDFNDLALEVSPIAKHVLGLAAERTWEGTATDLLSVLEAKAADADKRLKTWPKNARTLAGTLKRLAPNLRQAGIDVRQWKQTDKSRRRMITLARMEPRSSVRTVRTVRSGSFASDDRPGSVRPASATECEKTGETPPRTQPDATDGDLPAYSGDQGEAWEEVRI